MDPTSQPLSQLFLAFVNINGFRGSLSQSHNSLISQEVYSRMMQEVLERDSGGFFVSLVGLVFWVRGLHSVQEYLKSLN